MDIYEEPLLDSEDDLYLLQCLYSCENDTEEAKMQDHGDTALANEEYDSDSIPLASYFAKRNTDTWTTSTGLAPAEVGSTDQNQSPTYTTLVPLSEEPQEQETPPAQELTEEDPVDDRGRKIRKPDNCLQRSVKKTVDQEEQEDPSEDDQYLLQCLNEIDTEQAEVQDHATLADEEYDSDSIPLALYFAKRNTVTRTTSTELASAEASSTDQSPTYTTLVPLSEEPQELETSPPRELTEEDHVDPQELTEEDPVDHRGRKRRKPENCLQRNVRTKKRNMGEEYLSVRGKKVQSRKMKSGCSNGCKFKCHENIVIKAREAIFEGFWALGDCQRQWDFLCTYVKEKEVTRTLNTEGKNSRRQKTKIWSMPVGDETIRVCKPFFLDTLDISERRVQTAIDKKSAVKFTSQDMRGKHGRRTNKKEQERQAIKTHIESFPAIESHYCRQNTQRRYLQGDLSLQKMYDLYTEGRSNAASLTTFKNIFYNDYNLGFHRPKKDICDFCSVFLQKDTDGDMDRAEYEEHRKDIESIRKYKTAVKEEAKGNKDIGGATFDLEEVLPTPKSNESCLYYKRKLNNYNLTVFDFGSSQGKNYLWNENQAKRGSIEIASCVYKYLLDMAAEGKKKIILFSDSCSGQNRNKNFLGMLWFVVQSTTIKEIEHNFFVRGHSENESDSVHSTISRASKNVSIYTTPQWAATIRNAKRTNPKYLVHEMGQDDFLDFSQISDNFKNLNVDMEGEKINWLIIKRYVVRKSNPQEFVAYQDYSGQEHVINFTQGLRRRSSQLSLEVRPLERAYSNPLNDLKLEVSL